MSSSSPRNVNDDGDAVVQTDLYQGLSSVPRGLYLIRVVSLFVVALLFVHVPVYTPVDGIFTHTWMSMWNATDNACRNSVPIFFSHTVANLSASQDGSAVRFLFLPIYATQASFAAVIEHKFSATAFAAAGRQIANVAALAAWRPADRTMPSVPNEPSAVLSHAAQLLAPDGTGMCSPPVLMTALLYYGLCLMYFGLGITFLVFLDLIPQRRSTRHRASLFWAERLYALKRQPMRAFDVRLLGRVARGLAVNFGPVTFLYACLFVLVTAPTDNTAAVAWTGGADVVAFGRRWVADVISGTVVTKGLMSHAGPTPGRQGGFQGGLLPFAGYFMLNVVGEEVFFYYSHRLLHWGPLYRSVHKVHHEFTSPIALTAAYCHPIEHVVSNLLAGTAMATLFQAPPSTLWVWVVSTAVVTQLHHCGFRFAGDGTDIQPDFHDLHHEKFRINFGLLGWLDAFHGTGVLVWPPERVVTTRGLATRSELCRRRLGVRKAGTKHAA
eukprot:TRINITY_DN9354_c0_g1_i1.p1 TRINITY_DN9354_c0_g1~~TRINITY_DN9354_c0_g1_i1.p1  ORF type:complete len:496 (+),score=65.27 TRINITY_DN9354_c0_g1_i1:169-1656(+)